MTDEQMKRIWAAKLQRMILDATGEVICYQGGKQEHETIRMLAIRWFTEDRHDFRATCEAAGFDHQVVREKVLRMIERQKQHAERHHTPVIMERIA